jgi:hypothetical protein
MQSTDLDEIKAALWEQAFHPCTRVSWGVAQVIAVRRSKGHLLAQLRGRSRWHEVSAVTIERAALCPTGACDLVDGEGEEEATPFSAASGLATAAQKHSGRPVGPSSS